MATNSLSNAEIAKFGALADRWWDPEGPFKPLHKMNPIRLDYLRSHICAQFGRAPSGSNPFRGLNSVDVGCGGGLLAEPLTRMGANVTGIDAASEGIDAAREHAEAMSLAIEYDVMTADALVQTGRRFDVVTALEIIEHVTDRTAFLSDLAALVKPEGLVILSTLNRTPQSYAMAIVGAEYLLRWLPVGTHDWNTFPTPDELKREAAAGGLSIVDVSGLNYNPMLDRWRISSDVSINYAAVAIPESPSK